MVHLPLFAACIAAVFYQATTCAALPLAIRPSASAIVPVTYAFNPQRPFARPAPSPRLHIVDDSSDSQDVTLAPSWIAPEPFAAQASLSAIAAAVNDDSLFSDALFPYNAGAAPTGIEASIAAVLASRQLGVEKWQPDAGAPKKQLHRRSGVVQAPVKSARTTMKDRKAQKAGAQSRRTMGSVLRAEQAVDALHTAQRA
ncbi:hypothetical protein NBRC10513_007721 [Rhodotorula toruloides]